MQSLLKNSISLIPWRLRGLIKKIPLLSQLQRWLLKKYLEGKEFVHTVDAGPAKGLRYPITLPDDKGIWTGTYEQELAGAIAKAIQPGDVCFDIGSWRGYFSGVMALNGASKVFAFEPLPENVTQLNKMLKLNSNLPISLVEAAVADQSGVLEFVTMPETSMGKLAVSSFQAEISSGQKISVQAVSLDELISSGELPPPLVIKIDVEGAEYMVLKGGRKTLEQHHPKLFIEIHSPQLARDCQEFLEEIGYEVRKFWQENHDICHFHATSISWAA